MDIREAMEWQKSMAAHFEDVFRPVDKGASDYIFAALKELEQYRKIGTLDECAEAREKQMPKKPEKSSGIKKDIVENGENNLIHATVWEDYCDCPNCGGLVGFASGYGDGKNYQFNYCADCGQAIDWSGEVRRT